MTGSVDLTFRAPPKPHRSERPRCLKTLRPKRVTWKNIRLEADFVSAERALGRLDASDSLQEAAMRVAALWLHAGRIDTVNPFRVRRWHGNHVHAFDRSFHSAVRR